MSFPLQTGSPAPQAPSDFSAEPVYLQNPMTGMIFKLTHLDTIQRCLREGYVLATEEALLAQAVELARLQGRPLPPWATVEAVSADEKASPASSAPRAAKA